MKDFKDTAILGGLMALGFYAIIIKEICWPVFYRLWLYLSRFLVNVVWIIYITSELVVKI